MTDEDRKRRAAARVRELRESLGMEQPEFARYLGLPKSGQSSVSKWESGKAAPGSEAAGLLSIKGGKPATYYQGLEPVISTPAQGARTVKIVGEVQAGAWKEAIEYAPEDQELYSIPTNAPNFDVQAFLVRGTSMDQVFPDGTVVLIVNTIANRIQPRSGDFVLVQRVDSNGLHEASLKQLVVDLDGKQWLWPRSNDPLYQAPLPVGESDDVTITGRVVNASLSFPLRRGK